MIRTRGVLLMLAVGSLLAACGEAGSVDGVGIDSELFPYCAEARGSLLELASMTSGRVRVNTSAVDFGENNMRRLADKVATPQEIKQDIDRLERASQAWKDGLRAMPPMIADGRVIEPDTSALDAALINELRPLRERLSGWVGKVCGD